MEVRIMSLIVSVFKDSSLSAIKRKLFILYILNITDIIFTIFLINTGLFFEANFIMALIVNNKQLLSLVIKIILPFVLLLWIGHRMEKASRKQLYQSNIIITACLVFYILINVSHLIWCSLYYIVHFLSNNFID
jgi:hypothetical protein